MMKVTIFESVILAGMSRFNHSGFRLNSIRAYDTKARNPVEYRNTHRVPIRFQRFQKGLNPEKILEHYSRDDIQQLNPHTGQRTYRDAQTTIGKKNHILPNLRPEDVEANSLFQQELDRQRAIIVRIDKIRVVIDNPPNKDTILIMNKELSTPYDCASHLHDLFTNRSVLAEILPIEEPEAIQTGSKAENTTDAVTNSSENSHDNKILEKEDDQQKIPSVFWDMHRPLNHDCRIRFRHFLDKDVTFLNKVYWRSCSFVLGMAIRLAFKDTVMPLLHSWPKPNIKSGSFLYDVAMNLSDKWEPTEQELRSFTKILWNIKNANLPFERLDVTEEIAHQLFKTNPFKVSQIKSMGENNDGKITVYRCGGLLDMSVGPMISNTNQIGRITLASVHPFESETRDLNNVFYRFQGVSLPQQLPLSSYLYQNLIINRAKTLNKSALY